MKERMCERECVCVKWRASMAAMAPDRVAPALPDCVGGGVGGREKELDDKIKPSASHRPCPLLGEGKGGWG